MQLAARRAELSALLPVTAADFIARSAYQIGKTPLLPIFAASLGAGGAELGLIASVSTLTGMISKPLFGVLSDRSGRRRWLLLATALFTLVPFLYGLIQRPEQLVALRLLHGLGTAIYGPVTLAYVGSLAGGRRAERFGWFAYARSGGYIVGPLLGGWLLLTLPPAAVYRIVGLLSAAAFVPLLFLRPPPARPAERAARPPLLASLASALRQALRVRAIWLVGGLEALSYIALYALRAFLPIYALAAGANAFGVGGFFAAQEAIHILARPYGGRFGDRRGYLPAIALGLAALSLSLILLSSFALEPALVAAALISGLAQAAIFPATLALVAGRTPEEHLGAGMGLLGAMRNGGKVAGPLLAGALILASGYPATLRLLAFLLLLAALCAFQAASRRPARASFAHS